MVYDDFDGGERVGPLASIVSEDKHTGVLDVVGAGGGVDFRFFGQGSYSVLPFRTGFVTLKSRRR